MLPKTMQTYLNERHAAYVVEPCVFMTTRGNAESANVIMGDLAHAVPMADERGVVLAVIPAGRLLDVDALGQRLGRALYPLTESRAQMLFQDCEQSAWPPLANAYGLQAVVDVSLYSQLTIRFAPGRRNVFFSLSVQEFQRIMGDVTLGRFSVPRQDPRAQAGTTSPFAKEAAAAIERCKDLPVLPASALEIFKLAGDPASGARDLARIIELDGTLTANILRYANSPFYGYKGKIADVQTAITRVLGFDRVLGLAIGMSIGRSFRIPTEGMLGLNAYRRNAVYSAALTQKLAQSLARSSSVHAGTAYVAGLLHNVGQLFIGHVFPRESARLECALLANAHASMPEVERQVLGMEHDEIAARLLRAWQLPDAIVNAVRHHHDPDYQGDHAAYARLICIANRALSGYGLGINEPGHLPSGLLRSLGLDEHGVRRLAAEIWDERAEIEPLAQLVA